MSKPQPPEDLWDQLEAARQPFSGHHRPHEGFTAREYAEKFSISADKARDELKKLVRLGTLKVFPGRGNSAYPTYYVLVKNGGEGRRV